MIAVLAIFIAVMFTGVNLARLYYRQNIPFINFALWASAITYLIVHFLAK